MKNEPAHVLVVDDDPEVRELIDEYLTEEGFRVSLAADGPAMHEVLAQGSVDMVILDVRLPGEDGLTLAAELRQKSDTGIIMLSRKDDLVDRVAGLEVGADDYVAKPYELRELLARVRSVLRRRGHNAEVPNADRRDEATRTLRFADYAVDRQKRLLFGPGGDQIELSAGEFNLLLAFLKRPKRPLSRDELLDLAHGREASLFDRTIDVQVGRLRHKIEANPQRPQLIKTVRGVGYVLDSDVLDR